MVHARDRAVVALQTPPCADRPEVFTGRCEQCCTVVGVEADDDRVRDSEHLLDFDSYSVEDLVRRRTFSDECGDAPQRRLLVSELAERGARLGVRERRREEFREVCEPRPRVFGKRRASRREKHDRPPHASSDDNRTPDRRAHPCRSNRTSAVAGRLRVVLDTRGMAGMPDRCQ